MIILTCHLDAGLTPTQTLSIRKSLRGTSIPPPRSASPKKTGISGNARRSNGADLFATKRLPTRDLEDRENNPVPTPTNLKQNPVRRFSPTPDKSPLREVTTNGLPTRRAHGNGKATPALKGGLQDVPIPSSEYDEYGELDQQYDHDAMNEAGLEPEDGYVNFGGDDDGVDIFGNPEGLDLGGNDEQINQSIEFDEPLEVPSPVPEPRKTQSRRKRKSDSLEEDEPSPSNASQPAKKVRAATKAQKEVRSGNTRSAYDEEAPNSMPSITQEPKKKGRSANKTKARGPQLSTQQEAELEQIIEKVKARPGQQKSLYILRRETPADDSATHTRSGRVSVKPLAYWRNERCVYGGSPGGASLVDGARFPLNSIKEIIRTEEVIEDRRSRSPSKSRGKSRKGRSRSHMNRIAEESSASESEYEPEADPNAEPWEADTGIFRGDVAIWDPAHQAPLDALEESDLAYAPAAIEMKEITTSDNQPTFRYAKLISTGYFGSGVVELRPGDVKRPKNSRKMHMAFFVATGRVTVEVGIRIGEMSRFSVGKGGFWQVPRGEWSCSPLDYWERVLIDIRDAGNQYSIENELAKPARIFFSQGCEVAAPMMNE
jgi:centromere protein C